MISRPTMSYVGVDKTCGCIRAATVDNEEHAKDVRRDVLEFMKWATIERLSVDEVRQQFCADRHPRTGCPHPGVCPHRAAEQTE